MGLGIIYKATNKVNGKVYIGQTVQFLEKRIYRHKYDAFERVASTVFCKALRKYGITQFIWEIIEQCCSKEELDEMEFHYIKQYKSHVDDLGYNMTFGGDGGSGRKLSEKERIHLSIINSGSNHPQFGTKHSKERIMKRVRSSRGKYPKHLTKSHRSNISRANRKKYVVTTPEGKEFVIDGMARFCRIYTKCRLFHSNLSKCVSGVYRQTKGYKCRKFNPITDSTVSMYVEEDNI
jgi:group I intron endonuclease